MGMFEFQNFKKRCTEGQTPKANPSKKDDAKGKEGPSVALCLQ